MRRAVLLILLSLTLAVPAVAAEPQSRFTGGELAKLCQSSSNLDYGYCAGYVTAVADQLLFDGVGDYRACHHDAVRSQQYVDIFRNYVADHPETLGISANLAAAAAFARAFPCSR
jgi:hypothetical protein